MTVKRYDAHTNIDDFKSDWHEKKDGLMVRYDDYAALLKERDALAAENAGLKESHKYVGLSPKYGKPSMMDMKKPFIDKLIHGGEYYSVCGHISAATNRAISAVHGDYSWMPETPATDAAIANIKAQGVDMFSSAIGVSYQKLNPGSEQAKALKNVVFLAVHFAAQLRKGAGNGQ